MDVFWIVLGSLFILAGIAGSVLPLLPGPPLCFVGLLIQQLRSEPLFSVKFLVTWGIITVIISILDYVVPMYGTKKLGGSKYGMWGCTVGLIAGLFFSPWGIIVGPFVGAFIGEVLASNKSDLAFRAAVGSFLGFLFSTLLKLVACVVMAWFFVQANF